MKASYKDMACRLERESEGGNERKGKYPGSCKLGRLDFLRHMTIYPHIISFLSGSCSDLENILCRRARMKLQWITRTVDYESPLVGYRMPIEHMQDQIKFWLGTENMEEWFISSRRVSIFCHHTVFISVSACEVGVQYAKWNIKRTLKLQIFDVSLSSSHFTSARKI